MNMKRKKPMMKKALGKVAKKVDARKFPKKIAKPVAKSGGGRDERKIAGTAITAGEAAGAPLATMSAGTAHHATTEAGGVASSVLLAAADEPVGATLVAAASAPPEQRVRDNERIAKLAGADIVPLSHRRFAELWAFQLADALAAANDAAREPVVTGMTRIVVKTDVGDGIELSTFRSPSGFLAVRTKSLDSPLDPKVAIKTRLLPLTGDPIDPAKVKQLRVENGSYETRTFSRAALADGKIMDASTVPPVNKPNGNASAMLLGRTPLSKDFNGAQVMIAEPAGIDATTWADGNHRFVLRVKPSELFPAEAPAPSALKLEISVGQPAVQKLKLTYRITRDNSDETGSLSDANNTARTKLMELTQPVKPDKSPSVQPKDVPALHLLLT